MSQGLAVYQPTKMRDGTALALVRELKPELIVVAAYGRITAGGHSGGAGQGLHQCAFLDLAGNMRGAAYQLGYFGMA
ncbi:MAG: hypothetical protein ACLUNQ_04725 [Oscillospiraceae bacterium]